MTVTNCDRSRIAAPDALSVRAALGGVHIVPACEWRAGPTRVAPVG